MENKIEPIVSTAPHASETHLLHQKVQEQITQNDKQNKVEHLESTIDTVLQSYVQEENSPHASTFENLQLNLQPEEHDQTLETYLAILQKHGVYAALKAVEDTGNIHLMDDLHRFLVAYIKAGYLQARRSNEKLLKKLKYTVYEIEIPDFNQQEIQEGLKVLISRMEQLVYGLSTVGSHTKKHEYNFSLEVSQKESGEEYVFYIVIPDFFIDTFEKQILAIYPSARVSKQSSDYNIFNPQGQSAIGHFSFARNGAYPLKTYVDFEYDPMNIILNTFSKIQKVGEGVSIQYVCKPVGNERSDAFSKKLTDLHTGKKTEEVLPKPKGMLKDLSDGVMDFFASKKEEDEHKVVDQKTIESVQKKIETPVLEVNMRIVASAFSYERAEQILKEVSSAFSQFESPSGNSLKLSILKQNKNKRAIEEFVFRDFSHDTVIPLSYRELATLHHFPLQIGRVTTQTKMSKSKTVPMPLGVPAEGIILGSNVFQSVEKKIYYSPADRLRHLYVIGQTGTGKTTLLKNMIIQDIKNGEGACFIDPHGSDVQEILAQIPPERYEDVIYFDPGNVNRPLSLNMLEYDSRFPEQKTFVVNEMMSIFNKLFDMKVAGGPMFEQYFRNACMLVIEDPASGNTLLDIARVLAEKDFRELKLSRCKNPLVIQFWREIAEKAGGEASLQNIIPYITSKFDVFLSNEIMRPIVSQAHSSFDFREVMDGKKILLVNLAKGRLGEINSSLLGLILVGKILMAALSRVDSFGTELPPFYLYIDEFQNITTSSISSILSEARKYGLSLNIAHQFISQLEDSIKNSVFGNVGSIVSYRVGSEDSEVLARQFEPVFESHDLVNLPNHTACIRLMSHGQPVEAFSLTNILSDNRGNVEVAKKLQELSALKYGRPREEIEEEIAKRFK